MVNKCFVPNCSSGNKSCAYKCSMFRVPKDETLALWRKIIPRSDRILNEKDFVCEKHFKDSDIIREWISNDGSLKVPLKKPRLKKNAVPSIYPGSPKSLSVSVDKRRSKVKRHSNMPTPKKAKIKLNESSSVAHEEETITSVDTSVLSICQVECGNPPEEDPGVQYFVYKDILEITAPDMYFDLLWKKEDLIRDNSLWNVNKLVDNTSLRNIVISKIEFPLINQTRNNMPHIVKQIVLNENYAFKVYICGKELVRNDITCPKNVNDFYDIVKRVAEYKVCKGGPLLSAIENVTISHSLKRDFKAGCWKHRYCLLITRNSESRCLRCKRAFRIIKNEIGALKNNTIRKRQTIKNLSKKALYTKYRLEANKHNKKEKRMLSTIRELKSICDELQSKCSTDYINLSATITEKVSHEA